MTMKRQYSVSTYLKASVRYVRLALGVSMLNLLGKQGLGLGASSFSKEEPVAFETILEKFDDMQVLSKKVSKFETDQTSMERSNNVIWRQQPYIAQSHDGSDATGLFNESTQLT